MRNKFIKVRVAPGEYAGIARHSMATLMLKNGADIRFIQAMLGHAELSTTQIYTQVAIRQLQQVHAATHPGAKRREVGGEAQGRATPAARDVLWEALEDEADE